MDANNVLKFPNKEKSNLVNEPFDPSLESKGHEKMENAPSREEIDAKIGRASAEFNSSVIGLRKDMDVGFAEVRKEMEVGFSNIRADMANQSKETVKWAVGLAVAIVSILLTASIAIFNKIDKPQSQNSQPIIINIPAQQTPEIKK